MVISYYGRGFVKIQQGDSVVAFNPSADGPVRFGADLALVSINDPDYNAVKHLTRGERVPLVIDGPGEYETAGVFVQGWSTAGPDKKINTVYLLVLDGIRLVHLGALGDASLPDEVVEALGVVDVLFVPVAAARLVSVLEPKLIIPLDYTEKTLAGFLKEFGDGGEKSMESLPLKRKDLVEKEAVVAVVSASRRI